MRFFVLTGPQGEGRSLNTRYSKVGRIGSPGEPRIRLLKRFGSATDDIAEGWWSERTQKINMMK